MRLIIPEKIYAGIHSRATGSSPMASVTAWGTDSAARGRISTVDSNSKDAVILNNEPMVGFSVEGSMWKDEIRVRDPRGFCVNLKSDGVISLLKESTLVNGMIVEPCVYARSNGNNVLLNTQSATYRHSVLITEIANSKASWKNARLGNRVTLTNGVQGIYLGRYFSVTQMGGGWVDRGSPDQNRISLEASNRFVILQDQNVKSYKPMIDKRLVLHGSAKLARIDSKDEISAADAESHLNHLLHDVTCEVQDNWRDNIVAAVTKQTDFDSLRVSVVDVDIEGSDLESLLCQRKIVIDLPGGGLGVIGNLGRNNHAVVYEIDQNHLANNRLVYRYSRDSRFGISAVSHTVSVAGIVNWRCLQLEIATALGNTLKIL